MTIKEVNTGIIWYDDGTREYDPNFKSTVFDNEYEWMDAHGAFRRDPYKTMIKISGVMVAIDRQKEQTEQILKQQADAQEKLNRHEREGGTEVKLVIPDWIYRNKSMRKIM